MGNIIIEEMQYFKEILDEDIDHYEQHGVDNQELLLMVQDQTRNFMKRLEKIALIRKS